MTRLLFDIETNGFLDVLDRVHSLVIYDLDEERLLSFSSNEGNIEEGVHLLEQADMVVGHFILGFDIPALEKVYPTFKLKPGCIVRDTVLMSSLMWPNLKDLDFKRWNKEKAKRERLGKGAEGLFPGQLIGRHSLESWGHRLGFHKGDYSKQMKEKGLDPWAEWNPEMQDYCENDVLLNVNLWERMQKKDWTDFALNIEHWFRQLIMLQVNQGFDFDEKAAVALYAELSKERNAVLSKLQEVFPPWMKRDGKRVTPGRTLNFKDVMRADRTKDATFTPVVLTEFNPGSRLHIADRLRFRYGWQPQEFTDDGRAKVDEDILEALPFPEAKLLARYLMLEKRIGQLGEGKQAWLKQVKNGKIHGRVDTAGAVTRRCTHSNPNVAQVPSVHNAKGPVPYGKECRALFIAPPGYVLVGVDASGLELRCLSHYMARYDNGAYGDIILNGDVHTLNQQAAGLPSRPQAKRFIYAFLYGAGDAKIGEIVNGGAPEGKRLKASFLRKTPALKRLRKAIDTSVKQRKGKLKAIDGGVLHVRHAHAALNTLLQSAGAIAMKLAAVLLWQKLTEMKWTHGQEYAFVANIHDEVQAIVREDLVDTYEEVAVECIREAGRQLGFRCPLDGEAKHGPSWADTH